MAISESEQARLYRSRERKARELLAIGRLLHSPLSTHERLGTVVRGARELLGVEGVAILLHDEEATLFRMAAADGVTGLDAQRCLPSSEGTAAPEAPEGGKACSPAPISPPLSIPLEIDGSAFGKLEVYNSRQIVLGPDEADLLRALADAAFSVLGDAQSKEEMRRLLRELQAREEQLALQTEELSAQRGELETKDEELLVRNEQLHRALAEVQQAHAELEVRVQERTVELARSDEELRLEVRERKEAQDQAQRHVQYLSALRAIDTAITGSLDIHLTTNVILDQVTSQLGAAAAALLLLDKKAHAFEYIGSRGFRSTTFTRSRLRLGEGQAGRAALERITIVVPSLTLVGAQYAGVPVPADEGFTAYVATPLIAKGQVNGVLEVFHRAVLECTRPWLDMLEAFAKQAAIALDAIQLFEGLQHANLELNMAYDATLEGWSRALDMRDKETEGHSQRVAALTLQLATILGVNETDLTHMRRGALLHDIGKIGVPDSILLKPGSLTEDEWDIMRRHPCYAHDLLAPIAYLRPALDIPYSHHERWDGTGYPCGLKGESIPLGARIFAVADVSDAVRSDRPYRAAWPESKVLKHIAAQSGSHFDPQVVDAFFQIGDHRS